MSQSRGQIVEKENHLQLVIQAANNRKKKACIDIPIPYTAIHLEPSTLQGAASNACLQAIFPRSRDHIPVTFDPDAETARLDFENISGISWNGNTTRSPVIIYRNTGKFTLGIQGLTFVVSLQ